jgi:hypothetical protein
MAGDIHLDRVHEESKYEINRKELGITTVAVTPDKSNDAKLIEDRFNNCQHEYQPEIMDYEEYRTMICTPLIP